MSDIQNIIIVGASTAGQGLANALVPNLPTNYRILLIDALAFGSWPIGSLRAAVVPGWENKIVAPLSNATVFPAGSLHQVIAPNKVIQLKESSVVLEHPFEGSNEVPFFRCVLATGSSQPSPMRPAPGSSIEEYKSTLVKYQKDLGKATKVVVVGAGAVGVEMAGEIRAEHPTTSITIVHNGKHVLNPTADPIDKSKSNVQSYSVPPTPLKLSTSLETQLKELKIDTILEDKVIIPKGDVAAAPGEWNGSFGLQDGLKKIKLESEKTIEADYVFLSVGNKVNSTLVRDIDSGAIDNGMIAVDEYLKIRSSNPTSIFKKNYYAIGDCASSPGWKTAVNAQGDYELTAVNLINDIKGRPLKKLARSSVLAIIVPLGPSSGTGTITLPFIGTTFLPSMMIKAVKNKNLFHDTLFAGRFKGPEKVNVA